MQVNTPPVIPWTYTLPRLSISRDLTKGSVFFDDGYDTVLRTAPVAALNITIASLGAVLVPT